MVRINKVYTRTGDGGNTSLVGGGQVGKDHPQVDCYGTVDELNAAFGLARAFNATEPAHPRREGLERLLQFLQQRLFDLGGELATPPPEEGTSKEDAPARKSTFTTEEITWMEGVIDTFNEELEPLRSFILPGGGVVAAQLHQARTICRRAERMAVSLARQQALPGQAVPYLNRLSDLLFVMSRWVAIHLEGGEKLWEPGLSADTSWKTW